jgi:hypothetical protein
VKYLGDQLTARKLITLKFNKYLIEMTFQLLDRKRYSGFNIPQVIEAASFNFYQKELYMTNIMLHKTGVKRE